MNRLFTIVEKEMKESYFPALKMTGVTGIIIPADKIVSSNISFAKKYGFSVWINIESVQPYKTTYIDYDKLGVTYNEDTFNSFSFDELKDTEKRLRKDKIDNIDGFILKYLDASGIVWDESFKNNYFTRFSNYIEDYLFALFETTDEKASFRSWYYDTCEKFVYDNYVKPAVRWAKTRNIKLCFDIGDEASHYFYIKRNISIMNLLERDVSLCINHFADSISEVSILLSKYSNDSFIFAKEYDDRLDGLDINIIGQGKVADAANSCSKEKILLIRCDRGAMEKLVMLDDDFYMSNECDALLTSLESSYYCDMLYEKGFDFEVTNERLFEKYAEYKNKKLTYKNQEISQILLCKSCVFTEKVYKLLNRLKSDGVCINNVNLISILNSDLL